MKIIDDKGRFFGKINLLDLVVLIIIIIAVWVVGTKVVSNPESYNISQSNNVKDMYVTIKCQNVTDEFIEALQVGDRLVAQNAYTGGTIHKIHEPVKAIYSGYDSNGNVTLSEHPYHKDVLVTLVTKQDIDNPVIKVNGQEARIGSRIFFKTQKVEVSVMVMDIKFEDEEI